MPLLRKRNLVLFFVIKILVIGLFISGCQEGTNKSPVSALLVEPVSFNQAEDGDKTISGTVILSAAGSVETPLPDVTVALKYEGQIVSTTRTTTNDGKFFFTNLPEGLFDIIAAYGSTYYKEERYVVRIAGQIQSPADPIKIAVSVK
ncbi:MAG: hypothetical protein A2W80_09860 [Candidatus Riflebacteria bacterium GWC2_50_8]|nr:MAG: hypothetical protein A2W80_09860 [Candidatus Riflebacteria bacterium GWC2_50_8]